MGTWLDDATLMGIEEDLDAAHKSMAADLKAPSVGRMTRATQQRRAMEVLAPAFGLSYGNFEPPPGSVRYTVQRLPASPPPRAPRSIVIRRPGPCDTAGDVLATMGAGLLLIALGFDVEVEGTR